MEHLGSVVKSRVRLEILRRFQSRCVTVDKRLWLTTDKRNEECLSLNSKIASCTQVNIYLKVLALQNLRPASTTLIIYPNSKITCDSPRTQNQHFIPCIFQGCCSPEHPFFSILSFFNGFQRNNLVSITPRIAFLPKKHDLKCYLLEVVLDGFWFGTKFKLIRIALTCKSPPIETMSKEERGKK